MSLRGLDLRGQTIGVEGAKGIAASESLYSLQVLLIGEAQLDEASVRALAYAQNLGSLLVVDLSGNPTTGLAISELSNAVWLSQLEQLDLTNTPAPTADAARILGQRLTAIVLLRVDASWPEPVQKALREGLGPRQTALVLE